MKNVSLSILESIGGYADALQKLINEEYSKKYPNLVPPTVVVNMGYKYAQIVKVDAPSSNGHVSQYVHSFIDLKNGNILKAASWAQPAKGIRGNVLNNNNYGVGGAVNAYGALYYKGKAKDGQASMVSK